MDWKALIDLDVIKLKQFSHEDMTELIFPKVDKTKDNAFWSEISKCSLFKFRFI